VRYANNVIRDYILLTILYLILVIILPANQAAMHSYNLSASQYHILYIVVALPLVAIWFTAFYGAAKLTQYAQLIKRTREGQCFDWLSRGATWLAWSLPVTAMVMLFANAIANSHPGFQGWGVIITDYVTLAIDLAAFTMLGKGARGLTAHTKIQLNLVQARQVIVFFLLIGVGYCFLIFRNLDLSSLQASNNPYYLPVWLLITTIIIPYLYSWFTGLLAAYELILYGRKVTGVLYRQSVRLLAFGSVCVIAGSISAQYLLSATPRYGHLSLNSTLVLINLIYICMAAGFIFISIGAHRLKRIEEI
jgi:hypothetical protein